MSHNFPRETNSIAASPEILGNPENPSFTTLPLPFLAR